MRGGGGGGGEREALSVGGGGGKCVELRKVCGGLGVEWVGMGWNGGGARFQLGGMY